MRGTSSGARHKRGYSALLALAFLLGDRARAETLDPEVGRMLERALADAENLRKQLPTLEYDAKMRVQEWDARGRLRGTAKATAIMRPGDPKPMTFISREMEGKVRLPEESSSSEDDDDEDRTTLPEFSAKHQMPERFDFQIVGTDTVAGQRGETRHVQAKGEPAEEAQHGRSFPRGRRRHGLGFGGATTSW